MYCYTYIFFSKASFIWLFSIIIPLWYIWCAPLSSLIHNSLSYLPNLYLSLYMFFWILLFPHVSFLGEKCNFRGGYFLFLFFGVLWLCTILIFAALHNFVMQAGISTFPGHLSPTARDLISKTLTVNPMERIEIPMIRKHQWFQAHLP